MGRMKTAVLAVVACLLVAGSLQAQTATGSVMWKGVNGAWGAYNNTGSGAAAWNVYTSPYHAAFWIPSLPTDAALLPPAGMGGFGPTTDIFCVDFNHYANTGTNGAFFTNLGDANVTSYLGTYTRNASITKYLAAAYLAEQIKARPDSAGVLNGAIWQIMSGQPNYWWNGSGWENVGAWASYAMNTGHGLVNASNWVVVTDGARDQAGAPVLGNTQEYLTQLQVVPEPATLLLLGAGMVVMLVAAGAFRRPTV